MPKLAEGKPASPSERAPVANPVEVIETPAISDADRAGSARLMPTADGKNGAPPSTENSAAQSKQQLEAELEKAKKKHKKAKRAVHEWNASFVATRGKEPTVSDKKGDPKVESMFMEYYNVSQLFRIFRARSKLYFVSSGFSNCESFECSARNQIVIQILRPFS